MAVVYPYGFPHGYYPAQELATWHQRTGDIAITTYSLNYKGGILTESCETEIIEKNSFTKSVKKIFKNIFKKGK